MNPSEQSPSTTYDLLLKGGHVIDPANQIDRTMDVAVTGNRIAAVAPDIQASLAKKVRCATLREVRLRAR